MNKEVQLQSVIYLIFIWNLNLIANSTANIAENIIFVRTFRPSTGAIVNAKDLHR